MLPLLFCKTLVAAGGVGRQASAAARQVVAQRVRDEDQEEEERRAERHLDQLGMILQVHEEHDHQQRLDRGDRERHRQVEPAEIDVGDADGDRRPHHQGHEDQEVGEAVADDVAGGGHGQ
jgi:hypothetical protein